MDCPKCGKAMELDVKDTSTGRDMRSYYCPHCKKIHDVDFGAALWTAFSKPDNDEG